MQLAEYSMQNDGMQIPYNVPLAIFAAYTVVFAVTTCRNNIHIHAQLREIHNMGTHKKQAKHLRASLMPMHILGPKPKGM